MKDKKQQFRRQKLVLKGTPGGKPTNVKKRLNGGGDLELGLKVVAEVVS